MDRLVWHMCRSQNTDNGHSVASFVDDLKDSEEERRGGGCFSHLKTKQEELRGQAKLLRWSLMASWSHAECNNSEHPAW